MLRSEAVIPAPISVSPSRIADIIRGAVSGMDQVSCDHPIAVDIVGTRPHYGLVDYRVRCWGRFTIVQDDPLSPMVRLRVWYAFQRHEIVTPRWGLDRDLDELPPLMVPAPPDTQTPIAPIVSALEATRRWHTSGRAELSAWCEREGVCFLRRMNQPTPRYLDEAVAIVVAVTCSGIRSNGARLDRAGREGGSSARRGRSTGTKRCWFAWNPRLGRYLLFGPSAVRRAARELDELGTLYGRDLLR